MDYINKKTPKPSHNESSTPANTSFINTEIQMANSTYHMTSKVSLIKYLHWCLFIPPKTPLIKSIWNNQLPMYQGLTDQATENHLPDSGPATDKGHTKHTRQGIFPTQPQKKTINYTKEYEANINPPQITDENNHF